MDQTLLEFVATLRLAGLAISTDEVLVAARAVAIVGCHDQQLFRRALAATLIKHRADRALFDSCFNRFFAALDDLPAADQPSSALSLSLSPRLLQLARSDDDELRSHVRLAGRQVGTDQIRLFTQKGQFKRRLLELLDWAELQDAQLSASAEATAEAAGLRSLSTRLQAAASEYVDRQYALHGAARSRVMQDQALTSTPINQLDSAQLKQCKRLLQRMIRRLDTQFRHRRRLASLGQLDVHTTLRRNMATDGVLCKPQWRSRHRDRPQVFLLCDVSGSVRRHAEFMLMFILGLREVLPDSRCFAFSHRLLEIAPKHGEANSETALRQTLLSIGGGATDYACALETFELRTRGHLKRRSVIIVLGDARNNGADPRVDLLQRCAGKAGHCYWLNPENRLTWNTGDSVIGQYAESCDGLFEVGTLAQIEAFCEYFLRHPLGQRRSTVK